MAEPDTQLSRLRRDLLECYRAGLDAVGGRAQVRRVLEDQPPVQAVYLIAIGKAASAMAAGALDAWESAIVRGLVISKTGHIDSRLLRDRRLTCIESAHPVPDRRSLQAGRALLAFLDQAPEQAQFLVLISGGASSLVEVLAPGIELADLARINTWLLGSGFDIAQMNAIRQGVSRIKGGRLLGFLRGRAALCLLVSDVRGDDPQIIGSGLLAPGDPGRWRAQALPGWLVQFLERGAATVPGAGHQGNVRLEVIATLDRALQAAGACATGLGYTVTVSPQFQEGDACDAGRRLARQLRSATAGIYLWGGETTVRLPPRPGRGGRCQALALCAAAELAGEPGTALLAAGTDGTDGPGEDAGALVDGGTLRRGADAGLDARDCIVAADSGRFLEAAGDLIQTGPTGTNVMDLMIGGRLG